MSIQRVGFGALLMAALILASAPKASSAVFATSAYQWAQPESAPVTTPFAQPPGWVPFAVQVTRPTWATSAYRWAQPGTAPVSTPFAQPVRLPRA